MPERELEQIASMPRAFLDGLGVGLALIDADKGRILFANSECCRMLGYPEHELLDGALSFSDLTHPDDRERSDNAFKELLAGGVESYRIKQRYMLADGRVMWAHSAFRAIKDSRKRLRWCSAAILDITAAKLLERQLVAAQDVAGLATWNFEVKKNSSETSAGYNALFGVSSASPGPSLDEMLSRVHEEDRATVAFTIRKALSTGTGYTHEYRVIGEQGEVRWLRGLATCLYDGAGDVANLVGATVDITSEKQDRANEVPQPMRDVLEYMGDNWNKRLNVEDIASRHGISSRSIYRFFEAKGDTFTGYVRRHRLQRARRMLIEAKPGATVTAIALICGFSNHGHFAKDYHDEFGELPSDTLRK